MSNSNLNSNKLSSRSHLYASASEHQDSRGLRMDCSSPIFVNSIPLRLKCDQVSLRGFTSPISSRCTTHVFSSQVDALQSPSTLKHGRRGLLPVRQHISKVNVVIHLAIITSHEVQSPNRCMRYTHRSRTTESHGINTSSKVPNPKLATIACPFVAMIP
jgi:hypothetical protein